MSNKRDFNLAGESLGPKFSVEVERTTIMDGLSFDNAIAGWFCITHAAGKLNN